jgi:hypothetical protein
MTNTSNDVEYMDEVRNTVSDVVGIVNAIYTIENVTYIDVKDNEKIHYKSPVSNWEIVAKCDE